MAVPAARKANIAAGLVPSVAVVSILLGGVAAAFFYARTMLNHDTSWYLVATQWWLNGGELYRDIIEVNPPLAFYMTAPAVLLSHASGTSAETSFVLVFMFIAVLSLLWFRRLLNLSPSVPERRHALLLSAAFVGTIITPVSTFGQREHFIVLMMLPFVTAAVFKPTIATRERVAIGVLAGFGLALKPYFVALPLMLGLLQIVRQRRMSAAVTAENVALAATCVGYAGFVVTVHPLYLSEVVPAALLVYDAYGRDIRYLAIVPAYVPIVVLAAMSRSLPSQIDRSVAGTLAVVVMSFVVGYVAQFKGWRYQQVPIYSFLCLQYVWVGAAAMDASKRFFERLTSASLLLLCGLGVAAPLAAGSYTNALTSQLSDVLRSGERFMALTANVYVTYPLANVTHAHPTSRYSALWIIPGAVSKLASSQTTPGDRIAIERLLNAARAGSIEDFLNGRPDVVLVDVNAEKSYFSIPFNYVEFFGADEGFARRWKQYVHVDTIAGFEVWRRRKQESAQR